MPAPVTLTEKDIRLLRDMINTDRMKAKRDRSQWESSLSSWRHLYEGNAKEIRKNTPWDESSNVDLGIIGGEVDELAARLMDGLFGDQMTWAPVAPVEDADQPRRRTTELFMQWALQTDMKFWGDAEVIVLETIMNGVMFVFCDWEKTYKTVRRIRKFTDFKKDMGVDPFLANVYGVEARIEQEGDHWVITRTQDSEDIVTRVWIDDEPHARVVEEEEEIVVSERPVVEILEPSKVYTMNIADQSKSRFMHMERDVTIDWMKRRKDQGFFNTLTEEDWQKIQDDQYGASEEEDGPEKARQHAVQETTRKVSDQTLKDRVDESKDDATGVSTKIMPSQTRPLIVCFCKYDINADGREEDVIIEYDWRTNTVMGVD